eukprot:jgi/Tetstr1/459987/TSEL_005311.t1
MRFETLRRLRYLAKRGDWAFSFDLQDGYCALGLREDVRDYFTINVRGTLWRFAALPMGSSLSPYYFCTQMAVMVRYLRQPDFATYNSYGRPFRRRLRHRKARGVCLIPFLAPSRQLALRLRAEIELVWGRLNLAKHPTKAQPEPTQQLQHSGLDLDMVTIQFRALAAKLRRLSNLTRDLLCIAVRRRRHVPAKLLASLAGQGQFLYLAMPPARFYLREAHTVLGECSWPSDKVVLTRLPIRDLEWWRDVPTRHNGAPILRPVETAYLHTDSSHITLYRRVLKGKPSGAPRPVLHTSREAHPGIAELLEFFVTCRDHVLPGATRFRQLPDDDPGTWTAATAVALALDTTPPAGFCRSSHNLRSGRASAASATGVPMPTVRWLGGWAVGSGVALNYIVPCILDSAGARYFFGFLASQRSAAKLSQ